MEQVKNLGETHLEQIDGTKTLMYIIPNRTYNLH